MKKWLASFASLLVICIFIAVGSIFLRIWRVPFVQVEVLGINNSAIHWIGWIGALYLAFATPIYPIIKRRYPVQVSKVLNFHVLGNLVGVLFVSIHFANHVTRPASSYPDLGTGLVIYITMIILLITGWVMVSGLAKKFYKRFL
ncbi:MAG: hypothetical protein P8Y18_10060, partial [Candidatus Bathyarchaeota archaeon]